MTCLDCPAPTRPGALYCTECQVARVARLRNPSPGDIAKGRYDDAAWKRAGHPQPPYPTAKDDWTTGEPNTTCPACQGRYHYGAPGEFTHLCPLCGVWLCWKATGETVARQRRVRKCPVCGGSVVRREGKWGEFWGCENYPTCKGIAKGSSVEEYDAPVMELVVWVAARPSVEKAFSEAVDEAQVRYARIEARGERYKDRWWNGKGNVGEYNNRGY